tara:strand:- start:135 stop:905 length:771 start_codon:yes stop_codon:yes gene_type:complete
MEFQNEIGIIQRKMAASVAGSSRRLEILHVLDIKAGQQVLDIGCGGGHLLEELAKAVGPNGKAIGLDTSQDQLKQANEKCALYDNASTLLGFANKINLEKNSCDAVASAQTFEYIEDVDESIEEVARILKPSSIFANISILWDYYKFYGAEDNLNNLIQDTFKAHCFHQMLPTTLSGRLEKFGFKHIKHKPLPMFITTTDDNSPAKYAAEVMAQFAIQKGVSKDKVNEWQNQLKLAEDTGNFAYTNLPILTYGYLS